MSVQCVGDQHVAQEVLFKIRQWDHAIAKMDIEAITDLCHNEINLFDLSSEVQGKEQYKELWDSSCLYLLHQLRVERKEIKIYAEENLAFVHCQSKIDSVDPAFDFKLAWCRTTMCFQKIQGKWKVVHQHISLPLKSQELLTKICPLNDEFQRKNA